MSLTPSQLTQALYDAITAKLIGRQVKSLGHKDKQTGFDGASLEEMIRQYRQLWPTYGPALGLPNLSEPGQPTTLRGRPGRPWLSSRA